MCKLVDGRDWQWEKLFFALVGRALLSKTSLQLSADGLGCSPSLVVVWPKMTQDLGKTREKMQEVFTKDLLELKNKQAEKNNLLEGINSRIT